MGLMTIVSCEKEIPEIGFRIKAEGFFLEDGILLSSDSFPSFSHKLSGGIVSFVGANTTFDFRTGKTSIEDFTFELPVGMYQMEFSIPEASLYGQKGGSFRAEPTTISISQPMDTIRVDVVATCALLLVHDEQNQLDKGVSMIEKFASGEGYFNTYPLTLESTSGLYYAYFTPDPDSSNSSAYIWFYEDTPGGPSGGLSTMEFEIGYQYVIKVLD